MKSRLILIFVLLISVQAAGQSKFDLLENLEQKIAQRIKVGNKVDSLRVSTEAQLDSLMILSIIEYLNYNKLLYKSDLNIIDYNEALDKKELYKDLDAAISNNSPSNTKHQYFKSIYLNGHGSIFPVSTKKEGLEIQVKNDSHYYIKNYLLFYDKNNKMVYSRNLNTLPFDVTNYDIKFRDIINAIRVECVSVYRNENKEFLVQKNDLKNVFKTAQYDLRLKLDFDVTAKRNQNAVMDERLKKLLESIQ